MQNSSNINLELAVLENYTIASNEVKHGNVAKIIEKQCTTLQKIDK